MKPLLANRLIFVYLAAIGAAFIVFIFLNALVGGFIGAQLGFAGASTEEVINIVSERLERIGADLFHVALAITLALLAFWIHRRYVVQWADAIRWRRAKLSDTAQISGWIVLFSLGYTLFVGWVIPPEYIKQVTGFYHAQTLWGWLGLVVSIGLLAPLLEEWIFRGFMLQSYARRKGTAFALLAQAVVFSLIHGEPVTAVGALFMGWMLGRWILAGGFLTSTFWAHAINNLFSLAGIAFGSPLLRPDTPTSASQGIFGLILVIFVLFQVVRRTPFTNRPAEEPGPLLSGSLVLAFLVGIFLFFENISIFLFKPSS